ncbi:siderophore ABC transporter substrate-binding protein [Trueperella bialowiezensis]|uniref:Uncharacterized ABC transporter solute-binding protein yclQ n=1 Tax=Trueperella bialowiezensis TaxID=312285 RepID=A0A448PEU3_9ACTO|nr:ABC transporter substrate-binding protein [Trueperella bialowiezensis]VEI13446.1 Uncharacterized ABC transporter solute-binding protein yclQ precursor [Trueperella bialowiezensis]
MHIRKALAAVAGLALLLSGCSSNSDKPAEGNETTAPAEATTEAADFPRTVKHASGETTIEAQPERIVVMDMAALDTLDALGAGDKVVGTVTSNLPTWLADDDGINYSNVESVGSLKEPDMEAIAKLDPDLVVLGARSAKLYPEFEKSFTTIDATHSWDVDNYSETVPDQIKMIGEAVGADEAAEKSADEITKLIADNKGAAKDKGSALVIMTNGGEISLHDSKSRWAPIYDVFGFTEAYKKDEADEGHKGDKVSFETVKELNPDWIFVVDRDAAVGKTDAGVTAEQVLDNELVHSTNAWQNEQVVYLSPERWYIVMQGASNFPAMLNEIADAIK